MKYDSPIISTRGIFKKTHVVVRKRQKRVFTFIWRFYWNDNAKKKFFV